MQQRAEWLDFIKVFGVLATLFLHTNAVLVNFQTSVADYPVELNMFYWDIGVVFASLAGPSFALIFMYLGATVLSSKKNSISFFMGKIKNLLIPLLFWTVVALLFRKYVMHWDIDIIEGLLLSPFKAVANNMWVLYILIALFAITPIIKVFIKNSTLRQQLYFLLLWLYAVSAPLTLKTSFGIDITRYFPMFGGYIGYMVLGYILAKTPLSKKLLLLGVALSILGNFWTIYGAISHSPAVDVARGVYANYYFNRFSLPLVMNSIGSFILLRYIAEHLMCLPKFKHTIQAISTVALGMCMIYPYWFVMLGTEKIGIQLTAFSGNPLWSVPLTAIVTIVSSFVTVFIIKRIPYLHHVTPKLY